MKRTILEAVAVAVVSRFVIALVATLATAQYPWEALARWDALQYLNLARNGYAGPNAHFPGFPLLVRLVSFGYPEVGGWVLANLLTVAGIVLAAMWAYRHLGPVAGRRTAWLLSAFPGTVFLSAAYAETLLLPVTAGFFLVLPKRPWLAAVLGAIASATRPHGFFLALAALVNMPRNMSRFVQAGIVALGSLAFLVFNEVAFGSPFAFFGVAWGRELKPFNLEWELNLMRLGTTKTYALVSAYGTIFDPLLAFASIPLIVALARHRLWPEAAYAFCAIAMMLVSGPAMNRTLAVGKTFMVLFPLVALLGSVIPKAAWPLVIGASATTAVYLAVQFTRVLIG